MKRVKNGNRSSGGRGHTSIFMPDHPRASSYGYVLEHIVVAEKALGHPLPSAAVIHHVDGSTKKNIGTNLVICPDQAYHMLIHRRQRALSACGNANWRKCPYCKQYDDPSNMAEHKRKKSTPFLYHLACCNDYRKQHGL